MFRTMYNITLIDKLASFSTIQSKHEFRLIVDKLHTLNSYNAQSIPDAIKPEPISFSATSETGGFDTNIQLKSEDPDLPQDS